MAEGSLNQATLLGRLGRDAELRYTQGGMAVATLNLATTETWTDKAGEKKEATEWHRVVLWGRVAEAVSQYLTKGKRLLVQGKLTTRSWEDKDGQKRSRTEVRADKLVLLDGGSRASGGGSTDRTAAPAAASGEPLTDDDIPF